MLFRSEPLDKEELNGGVVYVLTIPRTRKETVCDSNTLREKRAGRGERGDESVCVFLHDFPVSEDKSDRLLHSLAFILRNAEHTSFCSLITRQGNQT
jgi:hypothetical protein